MSRFDYVKYDEAAAAAAKQAAIKAAFDDLETTLDFLLDSGRGFSLAITKLEEAYMWGR